MIGWNTLAWLYLLFLWRLMLISTPQHIRQIARRQDESASMVLTLVSLGCLVSLLAILFELSSAKQVAGSLKTLHLLLTGATLVVSWLLLPTAFTMHYAHQFYRRAHSRIPCRCCSPATSPSRPIWISPTSPSPLRWRRKPPMWRSGRRGAEGHPAAVGDLLRVQHADPGLVYQRRRRPAGLKTKRLPQELLHRATGAEDYRTSTAFRSLKACSRRVTMLVCAARSHTRGS